VFRFGLLRRFLTLAAALLLANSASAADGGFFTGSGKVQSTTSTNAQFADLEAAETALAELWTRLPYSARHVMFVASKAELFGGYAQRPTSTFAPGEKLLTYLEPVGYDWKPLGGGLFTFGVTTDFEILTRDGKVLGGQRAFQTLDLTSHYKNREFFVSLTLTIDGIEPGDYILAYTIHDKVSGKNARVEQPFSIKA
jgi:hypothetical protein